MIIFKPVRGGSEICKSIADLLERSDPISYNGANRAATIRACNDILQGRSDLSLDMLCDLLDRVCASAHAYQIRELKQEIEDFLTQKALRSRSYNKIGALKCSLQIWDMDTHHTLKLIDQDTFDDAVQHGFPPDFFKDSYFDNVTIYCMPDGVDCSYSRFASCCFSVCGVRGAVFDHADFDNTDFHSALLQDVKFTGAGIAHSHFRDCDLLGVSFQEARMKSCWMLDCSMDHVDFRGAALDGTNFGRIKASYILNLQSASITQGGATEYEVESLRESIFEALCVPMPPEKKQPKQKRHHRDGPVR